MDQVIGWLAGNMPAALAPALIHNDYKLDNIMLATGSVIGRPTPIAAALALSTGCKTSGSREFIPGKGWVPN